MKIVILYFIFVWLFPWSIFSNYLAGNIEEEPQRSWATDIPQESFLQDYPGKQLSTAIQDVANYLRNVKFNGDQRKTNLKGNEYTSDSSKHLHFEVQENCNSDFNKCVTYLQFVIASAPASEARMMVLSQLDTMRYEPLMTENNVPYDGTLEKLKWDKTASYYMCWYTMRGTPALSMLGESCDPLAMFYSTRNIHQDPRSDDKKPFACAKYSFCPDPCCPLLHVRTMRECYDNADNPCYFENRSNERKRVCKLKRKDNQNLKGIIKNHWNVSCNCQEKGFIWKSIYGMCVDINECITGSHTCNNKSETCLNLPGTFKCACKRGYAFNRTGKYCVEIEPPKQHMSHSINQAIFSLVTNFFTNSMKII
ncbi:uncharacterized protein [Choristoneura fumiferana]|uniref:uncharacterized protein n=1 Tax=Choristoneura fumiferana TaxID=7141 RepID=UPI003D157B23